MTEERCHIVEISNSPDDPEVSIVRGRVAPGVTTRLHRLKGTAERYCILSGMGRMETGGIAPVDVFPGDIVLIPPMCSQRITNTGKDDLVFLAVCTPPFRLENYQDVDPQPLHDQ
jgi:mannose-6-phosphate isomerase-like protein (cupin superfamily)